MVHRPLGLSTKCSDLFDGVGLRCSFVGDQRLVDVIADLADLLLDAGSGLHNHAARLGVETLNGLLLGGKDARLLSDQAAQHRVRSFDGDEVLRHRCRGLGLQF